MKMRAPAVPLITVDPYFSVWTTEAVNHQYPVHWTGSRNAILGTVTVDGSLYRFLGGAYGAPMKQKGLEIDACSTTFTFENQSIRLTARFTSPMLADDLYYASRPVSYLKLSWESIDGRDHTVTAKLSCSEELVLNQAGEGRVCSREESCCGVTCIRMGNGVQNPLWRDGDDLRIDWGYLYLGIKGEGKVGNEVISGLSAVYAEAALEKEALFLFAYDDIVSIKYFGQPLKAWWKKDGKTILEAISEAAREYDALLARCDAFSDCLCAEASLKGGEEYAELLLLAYRQVMAAHKLVAGPDGEVLYISKECFSNGCAATVDVTYPSAPMYLYYNPELLKGMLRPVLKFARTDAWQFDFAPHDAGRYPVVDGQRYGPGDLRMQMPVEECGNVIILTAAVCEREGDYAFARENLDLLEKWNRYLIQYGEDPENQLCTDDFAGHLSHNCNLSLKAIMGIAGYARILEHLGREEESDGLMRKAGEYAQSFLRRAQNPDGSFRLAYDREGTFSLKYNAVWDKLWETGLLPEEFFRGEIARYKKEAMPYGVPLDSRETYTKSDWILWAACLADNREDFTFFTKLLWNAYHCMSTRVPMSDWYFADTAEMRGFQHRTVQGGLFLKLLMD